MDVFYNQVSKRTTNILCEGIGGAAEFTCTAFQECCAAANACCEKYSAGEIAGVVLCVLVIVTMIICVGCLLLRENQKKSETPVDHV